jgi:hypothetical protein
LNTAIAISWAVEPSAVNASLPPHDPSPDTREPGDTAPRLSSLPQAVTAAPQIVTATAVAASADPGFISGNIAK